MEADILYDSAEPANEGASRGVIALAVAAGTIVPLYGWVLAWRVGNPLGPVIQGISLVGAAFVAVALIGEFRRRRSPIGDPILTAIAIWSRTGSSSLRRGGYREFRFRDYARMELAHRDSYTFVSLYRSGKRVGRGPFEFFDPGRRALALIGECAERAGLEVKWSEQGATDPVETTRP